MATRKKVYSTKQKIRLTVNPKQNTAQVNVPTMGGRGTGGFGANTVKAYVKSKRPQ